jgi:hypothetical protein
MPRDRGKIYFGLGCFVILMLFPIWYNVAGGRATYRPEVQKPTGGEKDCVAPVEYMKANHMNLLNTWRDYYVREGARGRMWTAPGGREFRMSLTETCLKGCHTNKAEFCDKCHNYVGVNPYCFDCHLIPKAKTP